MYRQNQIFKVRGQGLELIYGFQYCLRTHSTGFHNLDFCCVYVSATSCVDSNYIGAS